MRVLGIDPGSRVTGYGVVEYDNNQFKHVDSGEIKLPKGELPIRLTQIYQGISKIIVKFNPDIAAVEDVFISANPRSALLLGHARGSAICAAAAHNVEIVEYTAREVKLSVTGTGSASKSQLQYMVRMLLCLADSPSVDQADALACAITHGLRSQLAGLVNHQHFLEVPVKSAYAP